MKVSDYIIEFFEKKGIKHIFGYQGSSISHIIDSISKSQIKFIHSRHEQGAGFAACGLAMVDRDVAVAVSCSGPGAINLISPIADAWFDSLPCFFITGQVSTSGIRKEKTIRQLGFQETDFISMIKDISKYAVTITEASCIKYHLEKAWNEMTTGRLGPVILDIPHNIQTANIDVQNLEGYSSINDTYGYELEKIEYASSLIKKSKRPLLLLGGGAYRLKNSKILEHFCSENSIPVVSSYLGKDIFDNSNNNFMGVIGVYGNRIANLSVKYSDLLIVIGSRLDGRQTGDDLENYAKDADVIYVDIDKYEIKSKPERFYSIYCDSLYFFEKLEEYDLFRKDKKWVNILVKWKNEFLAENEYPKNLDSINPNLMIKLVSERFENSITTFDVGQNQIWGNTSSLTNPRGYLIQSGGLGSMGFALPAIIGAYYSRENQSHNKVLLCMCGDGGFQMNIQELQTISKNGIKANIFIFNNESLGLIRVYQNKALNGNLEGSVDGFGNPIYEHIAKAYDMYYLKIKDNEELDKVFELIEFSEKSCIIEVMISTESVTFPEQGYKAPVTNQQPEVGLEKLIEMEKDIYGNK